MKPLIKYLLIGIILVAALLRLYGLTDIPPGVNRDEASIGFTAHSLMTTGRDEYGRFLPVSFESFGDWKLPLYIYTTIPFVGIFGLSELAVRLPSALAGIAAVTVLFTLTRLLFASESIALLASLSLALMPWHIHISRVESEAIVSVFFTILGSILFLRALNKKSWKELTAAAVLFGATYWTYHGTHVSTSLLLIGMAFIYWKDILRIPRWWIAVAAGSVLTLGILSATFSADHTKISGISIFGDPTVIHTRIEQPRQIHDNPDSFPAKIFHNRLTYAGITIFQNYLKSYGTEFLFVSGGGNRAHNIAGYGNLHPMEAVLLLIGVAWLTGQIKKKETRFILWWLVVGGVAAAITKDAPHSNRMLAVVPALAIATGAGASMLIQSAGKLRGIFILIILLFGYTVSMGYYLDRYIVHFPKSEAAHWGYAYKQLVPVLFSPENIHKKVIMTHPETSPYIYLLFYNGYSASDYQKQAKRYPISGDGFTDVSGFGRFSFRSIDWQNDPSQKQSLIVARADEVPDALRGKVTATIMLPDGTTQFLVVDTDK